MKVRVEGREFLDVDKYTDYQYLTSFYVDSYVEYLTLLQKVKDGELNMETYMPPYKNDFDEEDYEIELDNFCLDIGSGYREPVIYVYVTRF